MIDPKIEYMRGAADALRGVANGISTLMKHDDRSGCCIRTLEILRTGVSTACMLSELDVERGDHAPRA